MTPSTRTATAADADGIAAVLRAFNAEYDDPAPEQPWLAARVAALINRGDTVVVLISADDPSAIDGLALMRLRPSLWEDAGEAYLAELYVRPALRGRGLGRQLLTAAMDRAAELGCTYLDLTTTNTDTAAVGLYTAMGFDRHERRGPEVQSWYFEIDLPRP